MMEKLLVTITVPKEITHLIRIDSFRFHRRSLVRIGDVFFVCFLLVTQKESNGNFTERHTDVIKFIFKNAAIDFAID